MSLPRVSAQGSGIPSFLMDSLDTYVNRSLAEWKIPGAAVLIVKDGKVVLSKGYGVKEHEADDPVDGNTLFMIASNTKAFTGTALALLAHEGRCSLDDRVTRWLPGFTMKDPWVTEHVTLTDMVSHRLGMETFQGDFMYWGSDLNSDEVIRKFGQITPMYDFRTKWGYCNAGFLVAGECIGSISGGTWADFIQKRFIDPLGMERTLVLTAMIGGAENVSAGHTLVDGALTVVPHANIDNIAPAASISSSVNDLSHWLIALLDSGRYDGREVIPWQAIEKAQAPASIIREARHPFNSTHYALYGLGWDLQDYEGREIVSHTGGTDGFVTSVTLVPEEELGIAVLTNTDMNGFYQALKWEIIDAYLGMPYRDYSSLYHGRYARFYEMEQNTLDALRDTVAMELAPPLPLKEFEGRYFHDIYGYADLKAKRGYLEMTLEHHSDLTGKLEYIGKDRFLCTYSHPLWGIRVFPFTIENEQVKSFILSVADFLEFTTYPFIKKQGNQ